MEKLLQLYFPIFLFCLTISCSNQNINEVSLKTALIQKIIEQGDKIKINKQEKVIILIDGYCKEVNCPTFFAGYEPAIQLYQKEDIFMRGIVNFLEISQISPKMDKAKVIKRGKGKSVVLDIEL